VHVITWEQIAVIAMLFVVACASTLSRAIRDGDRRSRLRLFGLGCTSGFLAVGLYCVGSDYASSAVGISSNLFWIGVAAFVGFTAQQQDKIGGSIFTTIVNRVLGGTVVVLSSMIKKQDDDKQ
jgi:predicted metal-binding membrane protein